MRILSLEKGISFQDIKFNKFEKADDNKNTFISTNNLINIL